MISFGERCYSNQYDEISDDEFSGFANTTKFPTTKFLTTKFPPPQESEPHKEARRFIQKKNVERSKFHIEA